MESSVYRVVLTVKESKGDCPYYKVGDKLVIDGSLLVTNESDNVCLNALGAVLPYLTALNRETAPEDWINKKRELQCPDNNRPVIFGIKRTRRV